jgi:hypothetical protein
MRRSWRGGPGTGEPCPVASLLLPNPVYHSVSKRESMKYDTAAASTTDHRPVQALSGEDAPSDIGSRRRCVSAAPGLTSAHRRPLTSALRAGTDRLRE